MFGDTPLIMIEDDAALVAAVERLRVARVVGVDTEADSFHSFREKVCLIQLSDLENDYIVDPLKVNDMAPLGSIMADPETVKVLHGADYDIVSMKRDFGYEFNNVFDTMISSQFLGFDKVGLADLIGRFFGHTIDKKYQRHDWSKRPLLPEHLDYARGDTHWLPAIRELLLIHLQRSGRLEAVEEEFSIVEKREWAGREDSDADFLRMKGAKLLGDDEKRVLRSVWGYRKTKAKAANRPAFKLIPDAFLLEVAKSKPLTVEELGQHARRGSSMVKRHGDALVAAVQQGLEDERPLPEPQKAERPRGPRMGPGADRYLNALKDWRNNKVATSGLPPVAVANNTLLKEIARVAPSSMEDLVAIPGIRRWQVADHGEDLLAVVHSVRNDLPEPDASATKRPRRRRRPKKTSSSN